MIHNQLGLVLDTSGRRRAAETQYRAALRQDRTTRSPGQSGRCCWRRKAGREALVHLERAASLSPRSAPLLSNLGLACTAREGGRGSRASP